MRSTALPLSPLYREAILTSLWQQVPCAVLCRLMLDGGTSARTCAAAMLGFWAGATLVIVRRPASPGAGDLAFIRWGFLPLFAAALAWAIGTR